LLSGGTMLKSKIIIKTHAERINTGQTTMTNELKEIEKILVKKAKDYFENYKTFIHFPIEYKGKLNMISAITWGWDDRNYQTQSITIDGSNERHELDELWDRVLDRELDNFIIKILTKGRRLRKRYIKANSPIEAFEKACKDNNVMLLFNQHDQGWMVLQKNYVNN
jgi:hypothetical protein